MKELQIHYIKIIIKIILMLFKILNKLELNDVLKIKDNYYRINDYNLNLTNGTTDLNLISSFDILINS